MKKLDGIHHPTRIRAVKLGSAIMEIHKIDIGQISPPAPYMSIVEGPFYREHRNQFIEWFKRKFEINNGR